ncbi:MAG: hypothetical protein K9G41_05110 [Flavobacteriales bacterium]|nr:hypothetical protein [Flavobacteriales bacterium]
MKNALVIGMIGSIALVFSSCSKNLDKVLFGTWEVTKVEGTLNVNGAAVFTGEDPNASGTVKFESNGRGEQNYSFTFSGTTYPQTGTFSWEANDDEIIIDRTSDPDMIWTRITDTENKQVATYKIIVDANQNWDYTITLEK